MLKVKLNGLRVDQPPHKELIRFIRTNATFGNDKPDICRTLASKSAISGENELLKIIVKCQVQLPMYVFSAECVPCEGKTSRLIYKS